MRTKFIIGMVCVVGALLAAMFWHAGRRAADKSAASGSGGGAPVEAGTQAVAGKVAAGKSAGGGTGKGASPQINQNPVSLEASANLMEALDAGKSLNSSQVGTLVKLLREIHPLDGGQGGHVRKNDLMNALNRQEPLPRETIDVYAGIYRDASQDEVIRDYAIQHVYEAFPKLTADNLKGDALSLLREAAAESDSSTAGTAILALARLAQGNVGVAKDEIATLAFELARNAAANPSARISALQVIGQFDPQAAVPVLVQTIKEGESVPLQLSAIGALGLVGGRTEVALLNGIAGGDNTRLKPAAVAAIKRIQERTL